MKKLLATTIICLTFIVLLVPATVSAEDYTLLEPIDGFITDAETSNLGDYLAGLFNLGIGVASGLAVIMIVIGGITYMTTGSISQKASGREMITAAIGGLVLALASVLLLQTINPALVRFDIVKTIEEATLKAQEGADNLKSGQPSTETQQNPQREDEQGTRDKLRQKGISINNPCGQGQNIGCTNVGGLPQNAIDGLDDLRTNCGCQIVVTGGTEDGHREHGQGRPVVDIRPNQALNNFLTGSPQNPPNGTQRLSTSPPAGFTFEEGNVGTSTGDHWHVTFG